MIAAREQERYFTPEEYFAWEEQQLEKHELIDGRVYAMSGARKIIVRSLSISYYRLELTCAEINVEFLILI